jgi:hypothetical protein
MVQGFPSTIDAGCWQDGPPQVEHDILNNNVDKNKKNTAFVLSLSILYNVLIVFLK